MRKSLTVAVLAAAALPMLLTGCKGEVTASDGSKATITDSQSPSSTASGSTTPGAATGTGNGTGSESSGSGGQARPAKSGSGAAAASRACESIKARLTFRPQKQENTALIAITNTASRTCAVNGWPGLRFDNAANAALPLRAEKLEVPGVPQEFEVTPGGTVYAAIKWEPCDKAAATCNVVSTVRVSAPGATRQVVAPLPAQVAAAQSFTIAKGSLTAGILTRTEGEALMWEDDGE